MPIGYCSLVPTIATHLQLARPRSVLDLGIGIGFYGAVVRQRLDLGVRPWRTKLVGVEGFAGYRNPCWELYDEVIVLPIEENLGRTTETWDAILLLDVLEHFSHAAGGEILAAACRRLSPVGQVFVGTPAVWMKQGAAYGNEFERHRSLWTAEDLQEADLEILGDGTANQLGKQMFLAVGQSGSPLAS